MSESVSSKTQLTITERLWELEKATVGTGTQAWGDIAHDARVEIERQQNVNVANYTLSQTLTADLFKARAEIERLRAALQRIAYPTTRGYFDTRPGANDFIRVALEAMRGAREKGDTP